MPKNTKACEVEIQELVKPYQEVAWLFSIIVGYDTTTRVPRYVLYAIYYAIHHDAIFD